MSFLVFAFVGISFILYLYWQRKRTMVENSVASKLLAQAESKAKMLLEETKLKVRQLELEHEEKMQEARLKLERDKEAVATTQEQLSRDKQKLQQKQHELEKLERTLDALAKELKAKEQAHLASLSLSVEEAKLQILRDATAKAETECLKFLLHKRQEASKQAEKEASQLIIECLSRLPAKPLTDAAISHVCLPNEEMKAKIIGREGKNIKAFQQLSGVTLVVDDTPLTATLSSFDLLRREVARLALVELVHDGKVTPQRIEEELKRAHTKLEQNLVHIGQEASLSCHVHGLHPELLRLLGKLKFRSSYGQNLLEHSVEVANIMGLFALELKLDAAKARRMGLLHDIGKAVQDASISHAMLGYRLCLEHDESEIVANGVGAHHDEMAPKTQEAVIVKCADYLSGARPGIRAESTETFFTRLRDLEAQALEFSCVKGAFAINAGRELQVYVRPEMCSDLEAMQLAKEIAKKIQPLAGPTRVQISVIRETKLVEYT